MKINDATRVRFPPQGGRWGECIYGTCYI